MRSPTSSSHAATANPPVKARAPIGAVEATEPRSAGAVGVVTSATLSAYVGTDPPRSLWTMPT